MLVLARKENEKIIIDGRIVITVVRLAGRGVRLGIEAPAEVSIKREELLDRAALNAPAPRRLVRRARQFSAN
jgi:carbon storage regulator